MPIGQHHVNERKHAGAVQSHAADRSAARSCLAVARPRTGRPNGYTRGAGEAARLCLPWGPCKHAFLGTHWTRRAPMGPRIPMASRPTPPLCASPSHRQRDRPSAAGDRRAIRTRPGCWSAWRRSPSRSRAMARCCGSPPTARRASSRPPARSSRCAGPRRSPPRAPDRRLGQHQHATFDPRYFASLAARRTTASRRCPRGGAIQRLEGSGDQEWRARRCATAGRLTTSRSRPEAVPLTVDLERPEIARAIDLLDEAGRPLTVEVNRNDKYVRVGPSRTRDAADLMVWYFPRDWLRPWRRCWTWSRRRWRWRSGWCWRPACSGSCCRRLVRSRPGCLGAGRGGPGQRTLR